MKVIKPNSAKISLIVDKFDIAGGFFVGTATRIPEDQCDKCLKRAINLMF